LAPKTKNKTKSACSLRPFLEYNYQ